MQRLNPTWRKSTYSGNGGANCVEVGMDAAILIRDTTDRDGGTLTITPAAWRTFADALK